MLMPFLSTKETWGKSIPNYESQAWKEESLRKTLSSKQAHKKAVKLGKVF